MRNRQREHQGVTREQWRRAWRLCRRWWRASINEGQMYRLADNQGCAHVIRHALRVYSWRSSLYAMDTTLRARNRLAVKQLPITVRVAQREEAAADRMLAQRGGAA